MYFICFKILFQILNQWKRIEFSPEGQQKICLNKALQSAFLIPEYLFCLIIHWRLLKLGKEEKMAFQFESGTELTYQVQQGYKESI